MAALSLSSPNRCRALTDLSGIEGLPITELTAYNCTLSMSAGRSPVLLCAVFISRVFVEWESDFLLTRLYS